MNRMWRNCQQTPGDRYVTTLKETVEGGLGTIPPCDNDQTVVRDHSADGV
jgi:hypothetical protein